MRLLALAVLLAPALASAQTPVPGQTRSALYIGPVVGVHAIGGRLGYEIRRTHPGDWSVPLSVELTVIQVESPDDDFEGLFTGLSSGASLARRLGDSDTFLEAGLHVSLGSEETDDGRHLLVGTRLGVEVVRYPTGSGVFYGAGVYGSRLFGSELYPEDVGATLTVGRQF